MANISGLRRAMQSFRSRTSQSHQLRDAKIDREQIRAVIAQCELDLRDMYRLCDAEPNDVVLLGSDPHPAILTRKLDRHQLRSRPDGADRAMDVGRALQIEQIGGQFKRSAR